MLMPQKVFCSAFTPEGWVELPAPQKAPELLLAMAPPCSAAPAFWRQLPGAQAARLVYADPIIPAWWEGMLLPRARLLKADGLHPRSAPQAPFGQSVTDWYAAAAPVAERQTGRRLLHRQAAALRQAAGALGTARSLLAERMRCAAARLRTDAVQTQAQRLLEQVCALPAAPQGALLPGAYFFATTAATGPRPCRQTLAQAADTVFLIQDEEGAAARMLLYLLRRKAAARGEALCEGRCPLFWQDKLDELLLPCRRAALLTENALHRQNIRGRGLSCAALYHPATPAQRRRADELQKLAEGYLAQARCALREVWRTQAALAALCPLRVEEVGRRLAASMSMTAKNATDR